MEGESKNSSSRFLYYLILKECRIEFGESSYSRYYDLFLKRIEMGVRVLVQL